MRKVGCKELRYKVIHRLRDRFTVSELSKLLGVSRSGYYKWLNRKDHPDKDRVIADLIVQCHEKTHRTYGYRRVKIWLLRETGLVINHKAVLRIMRKYNLLAIEKTADIEITEFAFALALVYFHHFTQILQISHIAFYS